MTNVKRLRKGPDKLSREELQNTVDVAATSRTRAGAAATLGISESMMYTRLRKAGEQGITVTPTVSAKAEAKAAEGSPVLDTVEAIHAELKRGNRTIDSLSASTKVDAAAILEAVDELRKRGFLVRREGAVFALDKAPQASYLHRKEIVLRAREDGTFLFGVAGDKHVGSKYHREDVLNDLYARFADAGVDAVFDTGNWIDGEARFNTHDLVAHGLDNQCRLLAKDHPRIPGVTTYAVWGDDHEGWYAGREGIDVGAYCAGIMHEYGHDWEDLGFMEAHVVLETHDGKHRAKMAVVHPGGGSAYATSYSVQKIVESYEGGEKPAVGLYGHYHKHDALNVRNVWTLQTACCEDQTPFMRKKRLEAHVGGTILGLEQDQATGAIVGFAPKMIRYFNRGFNSGRWSRHGEIQRVERTTNPGNIPSSTKGVASDES